MLTNLLCTIHAISILVVMQPYLQEHPAGRKIFDEISRYGASVLKWRANADYKAEFVSIRKISGYFSVTFIILFLLLGKFANLTWLSPVSLFALFIWLSLTDGLNLQKAMCKSTPFWGLCVLSPWMYLLFTRCTGIELGLFRDISRFATLLGYAGLSKIHLAVGMSLSFGVLGIFWGLLYYMLLSVIPALLLFILIFPSVISRRALGISAKSIKFLGGVLCLLTTVALLPWGE